MASFEYRDHRSGHASQKGQPFRHLRSTSSARRLNAPMRTAGHV
jgi:hypothetical protein